MSWTVVDRGGSKHKSTRDPVSRIDGKPEVSKKLRQWRSKAGRGPNRFEVLASPEEEGNGEVETSSR